MKIARNHEAVVVHCEDIFDLENLISALRALNNPIFPVPAYIGDGERKLKVNSLKGFLATVRLEDFEEVKR